jgi:TetR/AcrR family transcriptional repressor of lmrAB and yxaGH operons
MAQLLAALDRLLLSEPDPSRALAGWMGSAQKTLAASAFEAGCPLATIALESTPEDTAIRQALADGFAAQRERLSLGLQQAGIDRGRAAGLAALIVSAYEGALVQARVAGGVEVMRRTTDALAELLRQSLPTTR